MSVDSTSDRVILEKKRNDELIVIATSLGFAPSPRAKKADLVEMIVTGSNVSSSGAQSAPAAQSTSVGSSRSSRSRNERATTQSNNEQDLFGSGSQLDKAVDANGSVNANGAITTETNGASNESRRLVRSQRNTPQTPSEAAPAWDPATVKQAVSPLAKFEPTAILPPIVVEVSSVVQPPAPTRQVNRSETYDTSNGHRRSNRSGSGGSQHRSNESQTNDEGSRPDSGRSESSRPDDSTERSGDRESSEQANARRRDKKRGRSNPRDSRGDSRDNDARNSIDLSTVELTDFTGLLDLRDEGFGFIRANGYLPSPKDIYVSVNVVRRFTLRRGDVLEGGARAAVGSEKYPALVRLDKVNALDPETAKARPRFEELTPLFPDEQLRLEIPFEASNITARVIDLVSPIGKGQRGLIVSPPKAGKTTVMKEIARCIEANNPEVYLMVLLVDERPEEVTDIRRSVKGEVVSSTFDRPSEEHVAVAELAIEKAKRMVEMGRDVVVILDGITRLTRAYNLALPPTGRIMSGGVDSGAIYPPKKFFGAARNVEEGGSLTILATALVETGSRMDEVIFEEFKGTGNMELRLDRRLAERRLYPAIDVNASSTRHEELLFVRDQLNQVWKLRRVLTALSAEGSSAPGLELLLDKLRQTKSNADFLAEIAKSPGA